MHTAYLLHMYVYYTIEHYILHVHAYIYLYIACRGCPDPCEMILTIACPNSPWQLVSYIHIYIMDGL